MVVWFQEIVPSKLHRSHLRPTLLHPLLDITSNTLISLLAFPPSAFDDKISFSLITYQSVVLEFLYPTLPSPSVADIFSLYLGETSVSAINSPPSALLRLLGRSGPRYVVWEQLYHRLR